MAKRTKAQSEMPPIRMVRKAMSLVAADAFSEEMLDGIRYNAPMDVTWTYEVLNPKRVKFWAILNNVIKNCRTPWTNSKAAANALKLHLGVVDEALSVAGGMIRYPASLNDLKDDEFDTFYEGAMAALHKITGIDPESLKRAAPSVQNEPSTEQLAPAVRAEVERRAQTDETDRFAPLPSENPHDVAEEVDSSADDDSRSGLESNLKNSELSAAAEADERAMIPARDPVAAFTAELCVDELMAEATRVPATAEERQQAVSRVSQRWLDNFPEMSAFIGTTLHTCRRVAKGDLRAASARSYLVSIAPRAS